MSSGEVEPLDAARAMNQFEPAIESNGCSSKAKQSSSNGHGFTIEGATITKTTPDKLFDSVGDDLDAATGLASDPVVMASEQDNLYDKELHAKTNEEQGNVSTIAIENNNKTTTDAKEYVGEKQPGPISLPKSILKNQPTTEPTFKPSDEATSEIGGQSYEDIMSSAYTSPTPSQLPMTSPLHKSLDVLSTIHEYEPLTDNTEPLEDTLTVSSASLGVPPTAHSEMPQPHEAEVTPRDAPPSEQIQERHAVEVGSQPEVTAKVASGNLNAPISVSATEPSSNADNPSAGGGDNGLLQDNGAVKGETHAQVTNENSVTLAKQAEKNGHGERNDKAKPEATVAERTEQSPADTTPAPFLDETTAHTNETAIIPSSPPAERLRPSEAEGTEVGKGGPEHATVAQGDVVLKAVPARGHDSAADAYGGKATSDQLVLVEASTAASPPEETAVNVQTEAEAAQTSEDQQTGGPDLVEGAKKEIPPTGTDQSDAPTPTPQAGERAQEPLIGLHQDQQPTESTNEAARPYDPGPITGGLNESQIDAFFKEPQTTSVLGDAKVDNSFSPGSPPLERSVATANNLGAKEHSGALLDEELQERAYIEGSRSYDPTANVNAPNIELHGVSVVGSIPVLGGATQGEHDVTCEIQRESLGALADENTEAVNTPIGSPAALNDKMDGLNLEGSHEIFEQPKTVDAVSEAPDFLIVDGIEQSALEAPKGVEANDQDKRPEVAIDDSEAAGEPQTEMGQEHPNESIAPAQAEGQDTPADSIRKDISSKEVTPTDHSTILPTEDIAHVVTVEYPTEEPIDSFHQGGKPEGHPEPTSNESAAQVTVDVANEMRETIAGPSSEATLAEPDKIVTNPVDPVEPKDGQSAETSKDGSPATNGEDSIAEPLKEAEELPSVGATSTSVMDPMKEIGSDHGPPGLTKDNTPKPKLLHDANLLEELRNADESSVDRPSKKPTLGDILPVDAILASETCDESATKEAAVPDLASEDPQSMGAQSFQRPSDISNNLQLLQVVEGVGAEALSTPEPSKGAPPALTIGEGVAAGTTVEDTTTIQGSVELLVVSPTGDISSDVGGHPEQALQGACTAQVQRDGNGERASVSGSESKVSIAPAEAVSTAKGAASDLNLEPQVIPVVDTVKEMDEGSTTNLTEKMFNIEDPAPPALEGLAGGEEPQETGGRATPASDGLHIRSEQDKVALGALQCIGCSPKSPAGVNAVPDDHNAYVDEFSPRGELLQPDSPKQVGGEAPQNGGLDQQSEVVKDEGEVKAPPFPADKLDGSCPPGESVSYPALPPLDELTANAPTELTGKGYGGPFESISVIQSDGQRSQAPETSTMLLGPEEPALHHTDPPAEFAIEKGKYQPVPEEATQKERSTTPYETTDAMGSYISQPPYEPPATTEHEVEPQPSTVVVPAPVVHGAPVPVLSGDHTLLDQSTPSDPLAVTTTTTIPDTVRGDALAKLIMVGDQGEDWNAPSGQDTMPGDGFASTTPCGQSAEPSHEVEATIVSVRDAKLTDEPIPSGDKLLSEINTDVVAEDDVDHTWVADDGGTATTVVLPDPPSTDPACSGSETIALAKLDTKPPHSEAILETLYISLLSPEEVHEQQISYLVGELPKVAVMVPPVGPHNANQEIEIQMQEEKEAEQAAKKIEAERVEIERSVSYNIEPNAVEGARTPSVAFEDVSPLPDESAAQETNVSQPTKILDKPPDLAVEKQAAQDAGTEQFAEKATSEVSVDDTISDEPAPTESSDGEPIAIATEASEFEDTQEILKPFTPSHGETDLTLSLTDAPLAADSTPPPAVLSVTCPPPTETAISTHVFKEEHELLEQGPSDVDITPGADGNRPPAAVAKDLDQSPSAEPTIEGVGVVENATSNNGVVVEQTKSVAEEFAAKEETEKTAGEATEKARIEQEAREAEKEKERQAQLKLEEERQNEPVKVDEVQRVELETLELQRQAGLVEKQTRVEEEAQKLRDTLIAKLEAEAARLEAEFKEREQARLLAVEKDIEEASDCPVAPSTPRSELSSITSGFDSPSQISLASHMATAPDSPRIAPEDPTPFVELPESNLILQNRSPKSINSSIAGEPPETPLGSLPNSSLLANDLTPPARTFSQTGRPASFRLGSPLHISTENVAGNNSTENAAGSHSAYDPPPVLVPKLSITHASTSKLYFTSRPEVVLPALSSDMVFPFTGGVEDLPPVVEDEDADVLPRPVPRTRHQSTISNFSVSHRMPGGWTHSGTVAEGRVSLEIAKGELSPVPRAPHPSAVEPESDGEQSRLCVIM